MKLQEVCEVYSGYALKEFHDSGEGYPVIKIGNICSDGTLDLGKCQFTNDAVNDKYFSKKGDIYVALSGATTGKIGIITTNDKYIINQRVGIVRKNDDEIPDQYIKYFLMNKTEKILEEASGCAQPNISPKQIGQYEFPKVDYSEMYNISDILDRVSNVITLRKQGLQKLDELIKARFVELFGDIISNERCWKVDTWSNVLKIVNGRNQKAVEAEDGKYLICGSGGAIGKATNYLTKENSVIVGRKGNINKPILMREKYWNVDTAFGIEPNEEYVNVEYLYMFCIFFDFEKLNKAVTIPSLTKADLLNIEIPIPDMRVQEQFATFVRQVDKSKVTVKKALDETQLLFDSLMQKYFG